MDRTKNYGCIYKPIMGSLTEYWSEINIRRDPYRAEVRGSEPRSPFSPVMLLEIQDVLC
jgi:hypothetical protein